MEPKIAQGRAIIQLDKRKIFRIASGSHPALDLNHIDGLSALQSVLYRCWRKLRHVTNKIPPDLRIKLLRKVLQVGALAGDFRRNVTSYIGIGQSGKGTKSGSNRLRLHYLTRKAASWT